MAAQQAIPLLKGLVSHDEYVYQAGVLDAFRKTLSLTDTLSQYRSKANERPNSPRTGQLDASQFIGTVWYDLARRRLGAGPTR